MHFLNIIVGAFQPVLMSTLLKILQENSNHPIETVVMLKHDHK